MENQEDQENIRIPDVSKTEQLLEDDRSQYQKDIDNALSISLMEIKDYNTKSFEYEKSIIEEYSNETKQRNNIVSPILFEIHKVSNFDKVIKELYQIIKPIMDSYCNRLIDYYVFDDITYNFIFKNISSLRISKINITFLETIFIREST